MIPHPSARAVLTTAVLLSVLLMVACDDRRGGWGANNGLATPYDPPDSQDKTRSYVGPGGPAGGPADVVPVGPQGTGAPLLARDLGDGAGGEKLGGVRVAIDGEENDRSQSDRRFVRVDQPGGDASTFAADVDTASYTLVRAALVDQRRLPRPEEVRVEELINRFAYGYPRPTARDEHPFRISADSVACPWRAGHRVVRVAVATAPLAECRRPPANLVFLIDVSGSMSADNKLPLLKRGLRLLVDRLDEHDRVAIVTYAGEAGVALEPTAGDQHRVIKRAIDRLRAEGSTNGSAGIAEAYRLARRNYDGNAANRVLLATDGDFNVGITDDDVLVRMIRDEANAGIFLNVLGFGMGDYRDGRLERLADRGHGLYAYVDRQDEMERLFVDQLPASLVTVAQDVKLQVFFNPAAVESWRLIGYEDRQLGRRDFNDDRVSAGAVGAGHTVTALYEIVPTRAAVREPDPNPFIAGPGDAPSRPGASSGYALRVRVRYQPPGGGASQLLEADVPDRVESRPERDTAMAMAAAGFAMMLRSSPERGACSWDLVGRLARAGAGDDADRRELSELVERARALAEAR